MDRGAWQATVHGVAQSQIQLKQLCTHTHLSFSWPTGQPVPPILPREKFFH